ncbi:GNAT family N-acetyltransferase [Enterococcus gallinarum]|uniref:GNAT family N-acetyltransferase n=1 Tax=Enterococcus gallinarum TaxID=1353 RepID=UPI00288FF21C|nr:GNAT family protein [Enterococcus gallinarum]MDT2719649.1 GNAT family protein [Enterococcus gallinarum]
MNIKSENFILRAIELSDQDYLKQMLNDASIENSVGGWSFPISEKTQNKWFQDFENTLDDVKLVIENYQGEFIGLIGASNIDLKNGNAEVHIKLINNKVKNKGIGTEVMTAFIEYCFNHLRLHCVYASILEDNVSSIKMFKKCGFSEEGVLKDRIFKNGVFKNIIILSRCV